MAYATYYYQHKCSNTQLIQQAASKNHDINVLHDYDLMSLYILQYCPATSIRRLAICSNKLSELIFYEMTRKDQYVHFPLDHQLRINSCTLNLKSATWLQWVAANLNETLRALHLKPTLQTLPTVSPTPYNPLPLLEKLKIIEDKLLLHEKATLLHVDPKTTEKKLKEAVNLVAANGNANLIENILILIKQNLDPKEELDILLAMCAKAIQKKRSRVIKKLLTAIEDLHHLNPTITIIWDELLTAVSETGDTALLKTLLQKASTYGTINSFFKACKAAGENNHARVLQILSRTTINGGLRPMDICAAFHSARSKGHEHATCSILVANRAKIPLHLWNQILQTHFVPDGTYYSLEGTTGCFKITDLVLKIGTVTNQGFQDALVNAVLAHDQRRVDRLLSDKRLQVNRANTKQILQFARAKALSHMDELFSQIEILKTSRTALLFLPRAHLRLLGETHVASLLTKEVLSAMSEMSLEKTLDAVHRISSRLLQEDLVPLYRLDRLDRLDRLKMTRAKNTLRRIIRSKKMVHPGNQYLPIEKSV